MKFVGDQKNTKSITKHRKQRNVWKAGAVIFAGVLLCGNKGGAMTVLAAGGLGQSYEPVTEITGKDEDYIAIKTEGSIYTVETGDCLWNIARRVYGQGQLYKEIAVQNHISDPDLIFPGQELVLSGESTLYIPRQKSSLGGMHYKGIFQFDYPSNFSMGTTNMDSELSAVYPAGMDTEVLFNIAVNHFGRNAFSDSWEEFCNKMIRRQEEILGECAKEPVFEKYTLENGDDIYFYSFELTDSDNRVWTEAVGYRLGKSLQAEFIGISPNREGYAIDDLVRYMTAAFVEEAEENSAENFSLWGGRSSYMGEESWDYEGFHNSFAIGYRALTGKRWMPEQEYKHVEEAENHVVEWCNPVVELAVRKYLGKGLDESITIRDLEEITYVGMNMWFPDDYIFINDEEYTCSFEEICKAFGDDGIPENFGALVAEDLQNFINLDTLLLQLSDVENYEKLGELTQLKKLILSRDIKNRTGQVKDISFLGKLENLEELRLEKAFNTILDWSVLENCPNLKYMDLETQAEEELILPKGVEVRVTN